MKILSSFVRMNNFNNSKYCIVNNNRTSVFANPAFMGYYTQIAPEIKFEQQCKIIDKFLVDSKKDINKLYEKETKTIEIQSALKNVETELLSYDAKLSDFKLDYSSKLSPDVKEKLIEYRNHRAFSSEISTFLMSDLKFYNSSIIKKEKKLLESLDKCKPYVEHLRPLVDKYIQADDDLPLPMAIYPYFKESKNAKKTLVNIKDCALLVPYEKALNYKKSIYSGRINADNFECSYNFKMLIEDIKSYNECKKEISKLIDGIKVPDINLEKIEESRIKVFDYLVNIHQEKADEINTFYKDIFEKNNTLPNLKQTQEKQKQILDSLTEKLYSKRKADFVNISETNEVHRILPYL